jgi:hypothetical protein
VRAICLRKTAEEKSALIGFPFVTFDVAQTARVPLEHFWTLADSMIDLSMGLLSP